MDNGNKCTDAIKISIIVPFYNSSSTLLRCLNSLAAQTIKNIELILINDGSTDDSLSIANSFKCEYQGRCLVLTQDNLGPSAARNKGLAVASGEYVAFVDSDDTVESTMFEKMTLSGDYNSSDIISCGRMYIDCASGDVVRCHIPKYSCLQGNARTNPSIVKRVGPLVCDKIFRRSLIVDHQIELDCKFTHAEDFLFISRCKLYTNCVSAVSEPLYHYYIGNSESISGKNNNILDIPKVCREVIGLYKKENIFEQTKQQLLYIFMGYYLRKCDVVNPISCLFFKFKRDFLSIFKVYFSDSWLKMLKTRVKNDYSADRRKLILRSALPVKSYLKFSLKRRK